MKAKDWNEGLNHIDSEIVENYIEQKDRIYAKKERSRRLLRFGAIAACFCLIIGAIITSTTPKIPTWDGAEYSAKEIAELFDAYKDNGATNAYTKVYVSDAEYLNIGALPNEEYIEIYKYSNGKKNLNKLELRNFIDGFLPKLSNALNINIPKYKVNDYEDHIQIYESIGRYNISSIQNSSWCSIRLRGSSSSDDRKIILDGETVQIDQRLTDEEIISSLQSIKNKLFDIFDISFSDVKVVRSFDSYSEHGAGYIHIYFYNKSSHNLNDTQQAPVSDYILIEFDNSYNHNDDIVSDDILSVASVTYAKRRVEISKAIKTVANTKMISLEDAEKLLYNGYVFGGHSCPLCMAEQEEVDFYGYDFVDVEYVFAYDRETYQRTTGIPFYAFYKKIGTAQNGNIIYAKTYVPAIEVSGYKEYFQSQAKNHRG